MINNHRTASFFQKFERETANQVSLAFYVQHLGCIGIVQNLEHTHNTTHAQLLIQIVIAMEIILQCVTRGDYEIANG